MAFGVRRADDRHGAVASPAVADGLALRLVAAPVPRRAGDRVLDDALAVVMGSAGRRWTR